MREWGSLTRLLEKYEAYPDFIAECVYAYILNYGFETSKNKDFLIDLVSFIEG